MGGIEALKLDVLVRVPLVTTVLPSGQSLVSPVVITDRTSLTCSARR